jgi:Protein of unknown function (DUF1552)
MRPLSRREVLRGSGVLMALPFLEAMLPSGILLAADPIPRRLVTMYLPCGVPMSQMTPSKEGANYPLSVVLESLGATGGNAAISSDVSVLTGLACPTANAGGDGDGDHARGTATLFTCTRALKSASNVRLGISMDQVAAKTLGKGTKFASIQLGTAGGDGNGDCDSGYACAYMRNISWASATQPLAKEVNPQAAFDRLFSGINPSESTVAAARRRKYGQSVLDSVKADTEALKKKLGQRDLQKVDEYQSGISEIEKRLQSAGGGGGAGPVCKPGTRPSNGNDLREKTTSMMDIIALAFQCDQTRVASFMLQNGGNYSNFSFLGINEAHHEISHHGNNQDKINQLAKIAQWEISQYAYLVRKLKAMKEADGSTVLDNSLLILSSEVSNSNIHTHDDLPVLVAGKGGGGFNPGRHVRYPNGTRIANLYVAALKALGTGETSFGDSTGALANV